MVDTALRDGRYIYEVSPLVLLTTEARGPCVDAFITTLLVFVSANFKMTRDNPGNSEAD